MIRNRYPDAVTDYVPADRLPAFRRNARRFGLVIVLSAPAGIGGYYVTTAARRVQVTR